MTSQDTSLVRTDNYEWPVVTPPESDIDLLEHVVWTRDAHMALEIITAITPLISDYEKACEKRGVFSYSFIASMRSHSIAMSLSVPKGQWAIPEQKVLTDKILETLKNG